MAGTDKKRIVLIVGGGIAAYKSLDLTRELMRAGVEVECVMTASAEQFIQPLSFASLSGNRVRSQLFDETEEAGAAAGGGAEMDHIALSRRADLLLVAPATANLLAKMAHGLANDLASTLLLATNRPILCAPSMNWRMWAAASTKRNVAQLRQDGIHILEPDVGEMACGEFGRGRLPAIEVVVEKALSLIDSRHRAAKTLAGKKFLITSGATREALDPVRFISNHSSGKQGLALAESLAARGGEVFFVEGVSSTPPPKNMRHIKIETAAEMKQACDSVLVSHKIDAALCVAAVCDWRTQPQPHKIKKQGGGRGPEVVWQETPDILASIAQRTTDNHRPTLVVSFAAETENLLENARAKKQKKKCDWIIANNVAHNVFGADENEVVIIRDDKEIALPRMTKSLIAEKIADELEIYFSSHTLTPLVKTE